jgi:predicted RNA-binding protein with PUA-like domain
MSSQNLRYWLMKSEPEVYSIDDLKRDGKTLWEGVRNYQARNFMMKEMQVGDVVLFYHSNAEPSGIAGLGRIASQAKPDPTQFQRKSEYFDPKATEEAPRWFCVEVAFESKFKNFLELGTLREKKEIQDMLLFQKGQRLSIQPVDPKHFEMIKKWGSK